MKFKYFMLPLLVGIASCTLCGKNTSVKACAKENVNDVNDVIYSQVKFIYNLPVLVNPDSEELGELKNCSTSIPVVIVNGISRSDYDVIYNYVEFLTEKLNLKNYIIYSGEYLREDLKIKSGSIYIVNMS